MARKIRNCNNETLNNEEKLFLAAKQGFGQYENSVTVVINPKIISKAKE